MKVFRDKFKLSFKAPEFHTNVSRKTGKKVVSCTLPCMILSPVMGDETDLGRLLSPYSWENEFACTAKAICTANDQYNEKTGFAVAQAKAESKCYARAEKLIRNRFIEVMAVLNREVNRFTSKAEGVIEHNDEYIKRITE